MKNMKIIVFCLCFFTVVLQTSCVPLIVGTGAAVGVAAGGVMVYDKRSTKIMIEDREITNKIMNKISLNRELRENSSISVMVNNYIVLLVGQAKNNEIKNKIFDATNSIRKIKMVHDHISIGGIYLNTFDRNYDTWLTTKVKSALLIEKELHSSKIKILTENSVIYMMGLVTKNEGDLASQVASDVSGVKKIVKLFEYLD